MLFQTQKYVRSESRCNQDTDRQADKGTDRESNRQNIGDKTIHLIAVFVFFFLLFCLPFSCSLSFYLHKLFYYYLLYCMCFYKAVFFVPPFSILFVYCFCCCRSYLLKLLSQRLKASRTWVQLKKKKVK